MLLRKLTASERTSAGTSVAERRRCVSPPRAFRQALLPSLDPSAKTDTGDLAPLTGSRIRLLLVSPQHEEVGCVQERC